MIDDTNQVQDQVIQNESDISQQQDPVRTQPSNEETAQQKNFKAMREKADRAERERDEAIRRLREIEAASKPLVPSDDEFNIGPDELAEGKHLNKVVQEMKRLKGELNEYKKKSSEETTEARIKAEYPDFDKVVSRDNIEALKNNYPEVAHTLNSSNDLYATARAAYTLIRKLGISPEVNPYEADKDLAQRNSVKPRPLASVSPHQGDSALSRANAFANGLTDDVKEALRKEMFESMRIDKNAQENPTKLEHSYTHSMGMD